MRFLARTTTAKMRLGTFRLVVVSLVLFFSGLGSVFAQSISLGFITYDGANLIVQHTADSAGTYRFEFCLSPGGCTYAFITFTGPGTATLPWGGYSPIQPNTTYTVRAQYHPNGAWSNSVSCTTNAQANACTNPPPTSTPTNTPTHTNTPVPPTLTPTHTDTPVPPTLTPTHTNTPLPPTPTPTHTDTPVPPTPTNTPACTLLVRPTATFNVAEGSTSYTLNMRLSSAPASGETVVVSVTSYNATQLSITPLSRQLTSTTWNTGRNFVIGAIDDLSIEGDIGYSITFTATSSTGVTCQGATISVTATVLDNDGGALQRQTDRQ